VSVDLSLLPAPAVVEPLDFETILAAIKADLLALAPDLGDVLALESEPATKLCEVFAYRELLLRARINDAARATMLAYARGSDLDNLAALFGVTRLQSEADARLRARTQLSLESYTTAGPRLSYRFHALSASPVVRDVTIDSPKPGTVRIVVLAEPSETNPDEDTDTNPGYNPGGVPGQALLDRVRAATSAEDVRPLCDTVVVTPAQVLTYAVDAALVLMPGPGIEAALAAAHAAATAHVQAQFRLGQDITVSGLKAALRQPGVVRVNLIAPPLPGTSDVAQQDVLIAVASHQAARCTQVTVNVGGITP